MSDPNERSEATQQGDGSDRPDTEGKVEATEAAERKAQELGVDLTNVEGTGSGGRVTVEDVENAQRQSESTSGPTETLQAGQSLLSPVPTTREDIYRQYVVLKATLAGPVDGSGPLRIIKEDGTPEDITPLTFPDNPSSFFAPEPPIVEWKDNLPDPQAPIPSPLPGTNQPCRDDGCSHVGAGTGRGVGRSLLTSFERRA